MNWLQVLSYFSLGYDKYSHVLKTTKNVISFLPFIYVGYMSLRAIKQKRFLPILWSIFGAIIIPYFLLFCSLFLVPRTVEYLGQTKFDSELWQKAEDVSNIRTKMVNDLLKTQHLEGMSRNQINKLLGVPKRNTTHCDCYIYYLGPERGVLSIDLNILKLNSKMI